MIHGHGDDLYRAQQPVTANFSTNVWYGADITRLQKVLEEKLQVVLHYPEPDAASFRKVAAAYHDVQPENVLAGNGATELFYIIAHAFAGGYTLLPVPSFTEYEDACVLYDHRIGFLPGVDINRLPSQAGLMFICNPNNPDGKIWQLKEIQAILEHSPRMTLVVDESFIHFAPEAVSAIPLLKDYPNLLVVRSMTKSYAIPGLRLGYVVGEKSRIEFLECYRQPWSVNALAIEIGKYLLENGEDMLPDAETLYRRQQEFSARIARIPGFRPWKSHTSFFLTEMDYDASLLKQYLLNKHRILIRDASNFRGLNTHYFRINTLTDEKNEQLLKALEQYVR